MNLGSDYEEMKERVSPGSDWWPILMGWWLLSEGGVEKNDGSD